MILTEEEAKTKRCPVNPWTGPANRITHCVGSECMAWRWRIEAEHMTIAPVYPGFIHGPNQAVPVPGTGQRSTTHGYCGIAGKP